VAPNKGKFLKTYEVIIASEASSLTFNKYQDETAKTAVYPKNRSGDLSAISYCALGLAGEAGEVANKVKKLFRDGDSPEKRQAIKKEVGDCLWYVARLLDELGKFPMGEAAQQNIDNLKGRAERGTLHGEGDNR
jgi:NTP pyrophosphatase (non-canonical NTP hydrolase)